MAGRPVMAVRSGGSEVPVSHTSASAGGPRVDRALHADSAFDMVTEQCRTAVDVRALHHIAHYSYGVWDLGIDVLDREEVASRFAGRLTVERRRSDLEHFGRQLHYLMGETGGALEQLRSGRLIRAVFDTGGSAFYFFEVRPNEYLVGATFDGSAVDEADKAMAKTVQRIRKRLRLGDPNPGGFNPRPDEGDVVPGAPVVDRGGTSTDQDEDFVELGRTLVRPRDLHFVARFEHVAWTSSVDVLDDRSLDHFFQSITRRRRREGYQSIGRQFEGTSSTMDGALRGVAGRRMVNTILDVEEGAVYFRRLQPDCYLMGVTLDQSQVEQAQLRFAELADRVDSKK
jgi:hypothetical protein